jgi:Mg2+ and Co2+ transporter CorA
VRGASVNPNCSSTVQDSCLYALMDAVVDRYFPIIDALETELEKLEERMFRRRFGACQHRGDVRVAPKTHGGETCGRSFTTTA